MASSRIVLEGHFGASSQNKDARKATLLVIGVLLAPIVFATISDVGHCPQIIKDDFGAYSGVVLSVTRTLIVIDFGPFIIVTVTYLD